MPERLDGVLSALLSDPIEVALYLPEAVSERHASRVGYVIEEAWEARLHAMLGVPWPCPERATAEELWHEVETELRTQGLAVGRYSYGGQFSDGDPSLAAAVWCAVRHLRPGAVVETGVARGVTSRFVLEALDRNGAGHLWSIDLPHLFDAGVHADTGAAVPAACRDRWTYVHGSSRRRLRALLAELGPVGVFVHDSLHTARNMRFEMDEVWKVLAPGGVMIVDDVYNQSFREFTAEAGCQSMVCRAGDGDPAATCPSDLCWAFGVAHRTPAMGADRATPASYLASLN
jgi:hypothetical protein